MTSSSGAMLTLALAAALFPAALASPEPPPLAPAPPQPAPEAVVSWMKRSAQAFDTCDARDDQRDLAFLKPLVGRAHIVALGEGTHGTSEFFRMKHRIIRYLASEMGFTVFTIEANMPEAYRVNDYVLTGRGDPRALLDGMYLWTWNTHELLDMIEWMRAFNASGRGHIQFTGFDMQTPDTAAAIARRTLVKVDPAAAESLQVCMHQLSQSRSAGSGAFATATSMLPPAEFGGHHVRYSGWIRTQDVATPGFAGLWMRADSAGRNATVYDNMHSQHIDGTRDWRRYAIDLDIPRGTTNINFGALLVGVGRAWFDSLGIEVDGRPWSGDGSIDLALEQPGAPRGFGLFGGTTYRVAMDDSLAHDGVRSLGFRSIATPAPPGTTAPPSPIAATRRLLERVEAERARLAVATTPAEADWAIQNVRIVDQCARLHAPEPLVRDSSMAENVDWILAHEKPGTRMVLWAHNDHVNRRDGWMGAHLAKRHGADMVVLGFATDAGRYTAVESGKGLRTNALEVPVGDALETLCHATGLPRFVLNLRQAGADSAAARYFAAPRQMRSVGTLATRMQFRPTDIAHDFDAIVYVDSTTATRPMHPSP
jgi:erythromycin esterase-like protein